MNKYNHFLTPFILLFILFIHTNSLIEVLLFSYIFGVLLDQNQRIGKYLKKPIEHRRTWIEEPFGLIFIGFPLGILLSLINGSYFLMVIIPYSVHIIQDYITIHEVSPLSPFTSKSINTGFFKSAPPDVWYTGKEKGISENRLLSLNVIVAVIVILIYLL